MVLNLQPAAALLALLSADALSLSAAERARREQFLAADNKKERRVMASNLVLDAEFHRAMLSNSAGPQVGNKRMLKIPVGGRGGRSTGDSAKKFAEQPRIRRLLANLRRKRALAGPVKRGVDASKLEEVPNDQAIVDAKLKEMAAEEVEEGVELLDLIECSLDGADVGLLPTAGKTGCDDGYACVPSDESALGGLCAPTATVARSLDEDVFYCPPGCPDAVCGCYENPLATACTNALVDACRDGTYVQYCGPTDRLEQAYSQAYCDAYVCLGDNGLTDYVGGYDVCDTDDPRCTECYCALYSSLCNIFTPICQNGSDAYVCYDIDYVCSMRDCCDQKGPDECIGDFGSYDSTEPTPSPGMGGQPTDMPQDAPPSGATSDLLMPSGGRYALLGATALAAVGLAQSLF